MTIDNHSLIETPLKFKGAEIICLTKLKEMQTLNPLNNLNSLHIFTQYHFMGP